MTDLKLDKNPELIHIKALLEVCSSKEGGIKNGYRPNHVFEYKLNRNFDDAFIGDIQFSSQESIMPGETKEVIVRFLFTEAIEKYLYIGRKWWIHDGANRIGKAKILGIEFNKTY